MAKAGRRSRIDLKLSDFGFDKKNRLRRMRRIADVVIAEWKAEARLALKSSYSDYVKSITPVEISEHRVIIDLPGDDVPDNISTLARIVEFGMGPGGIGTTGAYDVRTFLLRRSTSNIRTGKNGPYVRVPFERSLAAIQSTATRGKKSAAVDAVKNLTATVTRDNMTTNWGERLSAGFAHVRVNPTTGIPHKTDYLHGMIRKASKGSTASGGGQTSGFGTFRTASWAGNPWMSKGVTPRKIGEKIQRKLHKIIHEMV
jgi:hypothetical protein